MVISSTIGRCFGLDGAVRHLTR